MSEEAQSDHSADSVVTWLLPSWTMLHFHIFTNDSWWRPLS